MIKLISTTDVADVILLSLAETILIAVSDREQGNCRPYAPTIRYQRLTGAREKVEAAADTYVGKFPEHLYATAEEALMAIEAIIDRLFAAHGIDKPLPDP